jgi:hypothetical protein
MGYGLTYQQFRNDTNKIENCDANYTLKNDIIEYLWTWKGNAHALWNKIHEILFSHYQVAMFTSDLI